MIRIIEGTIHSLEEGGVVVMAYGVGYFVCMPTRLLERCTVGQQITLFTYHHIREDVEALYGFDDRNDLMLFRQLISVSGVGPRSGMLILSGFSADEIKRAIVHGDTALLTSISGIGRKTAERIVIDLKETVSMTPTQTVQLGGQTMHVLEALLALGYTRQEASSVIPQLDQVAPLEEQVRAALKLMSRHAPS